MAILSFDQLLEKVEDPAMRKIMEESRNDHKRLQNETQNLIKAYCVNKEQPPVMARVMARMETGIKLAAEDRDRAIAQITVKGCDTGKDPFTNILTCTLPPIRRQPIQRKNS